MTVKFSFVVSCFVILFYHQINAHEVILEKVEPAFGDDDKVVAFDTLRIKKYNRTSFVVNGKYEVKIPFDDSIDIVVDAFNFQGGQYKKMGDKKLEKFCQSVYQEPFRKAWNVADDASLVKIPFGTCPYPAGKNEFTNFILSDDGVLPPYIPGGEKWRIDIRFHRKDDILGGFNIFVILRNDQSLLKGG